MSEIKKYLNECIKESKIPGAVLWVGNNKDVYIYEAYGYKQAFPKKERLNKDTIYDLASLTKPLCTAMSIMLLFEEKEIKLNDYIEKYLSEFKNKPNGKKTIKELLTHTSGLPDWFPLYILKQRERIDYLSKINTGKRRVIYSCLGYIILSLIIERITNQGLDEFCKEKIFKSLKLKNTMFNPSKKIKNIAPTEIGNKHEKQKAKEYGNISIVKWRDYLIKGEVHDGNCFYAFNGVSGNAGLFSNAGDLAKMMRAYLNGEIVKLDTLKLMIKDWTGGKEKRGLGWWIDPYPGILSPSAFGHTGFTGTMIMADPKKNLIIILLSNSVHPRVRLGIMPVIRKKVVELTVQKNSLCYGQTFARQRCNIRS
ncbi:MAG: serine hydrolase [candidate division WOR-3 bacterium]|nr:serine hydrolase [candidate division WOR-3 bacterium]